MAGDPAAMREWVQRVLGLALPEGPAALDPSASPSKGDKVMFAQARLVYETARKQVSAGIDTLLAAIRTQCANEPDFAEIDSAIGEFAVLKDGLDERLIEALDEAYQAATPDAEATARAKAADIVGDYQAFYGDHERLLAGIDHNPFAPIKVESVLDKALSGLAARLR